MDLEKLKSDENKYLLQTYTRYNLVFTRGLGAYLYDIEGNEYLDFLAGISVCNLGHCNKRVNEAIKEQLDRLIHTSNLYYTQNQIELAKKISKISFAGKTFFSNSGTEANEAAIKYIRLRGNAINPKKNHLISLEGSFHGRSSGSLAITGQLKHQEGFEPLLSNIHLVKPNDIKSLREHFNENTAGIILETIQGENGVRPLSLEFLKEAKELASKYNALFILDEVQTGLGRTGEILSYKSFGVEPDGFTLAKSLANGLPIGAFHISDKHKDIELKGRHASTFGGNPLVCKAAIEVLNILSGGLLLKVKRISKMLFEKLYELKVEFSIIKSLRGMGLMIAIELSGGAFKVVEQAHKEKLLLNAIGDKVVRLLPPLIIEEKEVELCIERLKEVFRKVKTKG